MTIAVDLGHKATKQTKNDTRFFKSKDTRFFKSYLTSGDFCHLLITFANSFDPDQEQKNVVLYGIYEARSTLS